MELPAMLFGSTAAHPFWRAACLVTPLLLSNAWAQDPAPANAPSPAAVAPNAADAIILLNPKAGGSANLALSKSLDGQLRLKADANAKLSVAGQAMVNDVFNNRAAPGARRQFYESQDADLLERLWQSAASRIGQLGVPATQLRWQGDFTVLQGAVGALSTGSHLPPFALHPRVDLPILKPLIDKGELVIIGEVSAVTALNEVKAERQRMADLKRKQEDRTQNLISRLPTFGDSLVSLILPPPPPNNGKAVERRYCTVKSSGDMGAWTTGFRYLDKINKNLNTTRDTRYDGLAKDLEELYGLVQAGKCEVLITTNDDAAKLAQAMQRDKIGFNVHIIIPKTELMVSYAEAKGYPSLEKMELARQLVPDSTVTPKGLERLEAAGVSSVADFNAAFERMSKSKYASERNVDSVLAFLADEKEGKTAKLTALQVKEARDKKAAADRKAEEEADKAKRLAYAKENPYYAVISCGMPNHINIMACFSGSRGVDTELKVKNGNDSQMYKVYNLRQAGREERDGLHIDLKQNFSIAAQNSSDSLILTVKIYDRATGKVVFNDQAAKYGMVRVGN